MKEEANNDQLERALREEAEDFRLLPSSKVWEGIEKQINPRRRYDIVWWIAAAGLLLLLTGTWFVWQHKSPDTPSKDLTQKNKETIKPPQRTWAPLNRQNREKVSQQEEKQSTQTRHQQGITKREPKVSEKKDISAGMAALNEKDSNSSFLVFLKKIPFSFEQKQENPLPHLAFSGKINFAEKESNAELANQDSQSEVQKKGKVSWQVFFTPGISYRSFTINESSMLGSSAAPAPGNSLAASPSSKVIEHRKDDAWEAGFRVSWHLKKGWETQTGLSVMHSGYSIHAFGSYPAYINNNGNTAFTDASSANSYYTAYSLSLRAAAVPQASSAVFLHNRYLHVELPLLIGKEFGDPQKINVAIAAGPALTYMLSSNSIMYAPGSGRYFTNKDYLKPFNLNFQLEAELHIPLNKKLQFTVGPSFQYQVLSTYENYPLVKEHPYSIGIKTGIRLNPD